MSYKFENLDYSRPLYVLREFNFNGVKYAQGALFPWQRLAISKHIVARLWNGRKIRHTLPDAITPEPLGTQLPTDPPPPPNPEPTGAVVVHEVHEVHEVPPVTGTPATMKHTRAGWYNIEVDGLGAVNPAKLKGREAAAQWAAENNYVLAVDGE